MPAALILSDIALYKISVFDYLQVQSASEARQPGHQASLPDAAAEAEARVR